MHHKGNNKKESPHQSSSLRSADSFPAGGKPFGVSRRRGDSLLKLYPVTKDTSLLVIGALTMGTDLMVSYVTAAKAILSELTGRSVPVVSIVT